MATLLNKGPRAYHTKSGILEPHGTLEVSAEDAKDLLAYRDVTELKTKSEAKTAQVEESKPKGETPAKSGKK